MNPIYFWWRLVRFRPGFYTSAFCLYIGYTLSLAFSGLILRAFFDRLAGEPGALAITMVVLLQLGNTLLAMVGLGGANAIGFYHYYPATQALLFRNLFARLLHRPGAQPLPPGQNFSVGGVINSLREDVHQTREFDSHLNDLFSFGLTAVVAVIAMLQVSIPITLGVFAPLIAIVLITNRLSDRIERYRVASRTASAQVAGAIGEIMGAVQAIQVNNAEERILAHFRRLNETRRQTIVRDELLTRLINALSGNTVVIGTALVLLFAARAMQRGDFTVGDFALFVAYIWPITEWFRNIGALLAVYKQTGVSIQRLQTLMQGAPPTQLTTPAPIYLTGDLPSLPAVVKTEQDRLTVLEVRGLRYRYPIPDETTEDESPFQLQPIDLRLERGSLTVITARIGAGKSTLLRVLLGLLPKAAGEIYWNGTLVTEPETFFVPPRVAYTPQTPRLFSESLRNNILLGLTVLPAQLDHALQRAVLTPDLVTMNQGLDTLIGPRGMRLSGGQVQRTAAARMFVRSPELLVFDDLSSALDGETERHLWQELFAQAERPTCLVVSHRRSVLQQADQIYWLEDGYLVDRGQATDLLARNVAFQQLWTSQKA
jgi:ATP-binding cassette subfamily B protein